MKDLYNICSTCSCFLLRSSYSISGFWCVSSGYYVSVVTHVCVRTRVHRGSRFHQRLCILKSSELHKEIEPKVPYLFFLRLCTCSFPCAAATQQNASPPSPLAIFLFLALSTSVPVLVFVVPAVEVYVECHNAARRHASDQSPEGRKHDKSHDL